MEKLLSTTKKQGGKYGYTLSSQRTKNICYCCGSNRNIFLPTRSVSTKKSTIFRMTYLSKPITGLFTKSSQLKSGRVNSLSAAVIGLTNKARQKFLTSNS